MATTPLTSQDITDCVNSLGYTKAAFTTSLQAAFLLVQRNTVQAQMIATNAAANAAGNVTQAQMTELQSQMSAIDQQFAHLVLTPGG